VPPKTKKKETKESVVRSRRRTVVGVVTSDKMDKTIRVQVEQFVKHPAFEKTLRRSTVCYAHDEKREARRGDRVELAETRPLSRLKHWRLLRVVEKGPAGVEDRPDSRQAARPAKPAEVPSAAPPAPPPPAP
jgi:small subunit ribosomal protein S17